MIIAVLYFLTVLMDRLIVKLSKYYPPSNEEGSALALIMIKQIIKLFDSDTEHQKESKALQALKNNNNHKKEIIKNDSSSNPKTVTIISSSNIDSIDTQKIKEFTPKSIEMIAELQKLQCISWKFKIVSSDFYSKDIEYRAKNILSAPSIEYLCKSLLMKNSKCTNNDCNDRLNSKYYLVVFQYNQKLKQQKLKKFVKSLSNKSNKYFKFSLASMEETKALTNFEFNCVSPVGIGNIPIILSHHIINGNYKYIWFGSGSLDIKLSIDTKEFCQKYTHFVADITA